MVAMLLITEWHSKSINNPLGLSDGEDYELFNMPDVAQNASQVGGNALSSSGSRQRASMKTLLEKLNIVAPAYRSKKMTW